MAVWQTTSSHNNPLYLFASWYLLGVKSKHLQILHSWEVSIVEFAGILFNEIQLQNAAERSQDS